MNIVIVNIAGALNSGDHTQTAAFLKVVREAFPDADIACVHRNPDLHREIFPEYKWLETLGTSHIMSRICRRTANAARLLPSFLRCPHLLPRAQRETYAALRSADVIVAHPGGYMQRGGPQLCTALLHMTLSRKGKLIIGPQTIGPLRSKVAKMLTTRVLRRAACFCVREPCTLEYVTKELDLNESDVHLFPDLAFFERSIDQEGASQALRSLGILEKEPIAATTFYPSSRLGVSEEHYFQIIGDASKHLYKNYGIRTVGICQDMTAKGSPGDGDLLKRAAPFFGESSVMAYECYPPEINRGIVSRCQVTYGTRMHGNIYSLAQHVPAVAISYNHKTNGIMRMCGLEKYVIDLRDLELTSLKRLLDDALANRETIRQDLQSIVSGFLDRRVWLIDLMRNCGRAVDQEGEDCVHH